jgi:hypothetical protein
MPQPPKHSKTCPSRKPQSEQQHRPHLNDVDPNFDIKRQVRDNLPLACLTSFSLSVRSDVTQHAAGIQLDACVNGTWILVWTQVFLDHSIKWKEEDNIVRDQGVPLVKLFSHFFSPKGQNPPRRC